MRANNKPHILDETTEDRKVAQLTATVPHGAAEAQASNRTSSKEVFKASRSCAQSSSSFMAVSSDSVGNLIPTSKNGNFGQQGKTDSIS